MCSAPEKCVPSRHRPFGPMETPTGSHSDSPGGTETPGITRVRFEAGSRTRRSSWNGFVPVLVILTAEAAGETSSAAVTPAGFGLGTGGRAGRRGGPVAGTGGG